MSTKSLTAAIRAPFWVQSGLGLDESRPDHAFDNGYVMTWRNKADTADVSALRIDNEDRIQIAATLNLTDITPGSETSGSLMSNDQRWTIASGTLVSVVVASNVGTVTFSEAHGKIVGDKITISGATVDTDLNATYSVVAATVGGSTKKLTITTSSVSDATYTDAAMVITAWQTFSTAGAAGIKLLCANDSATGNFATVRLRARSDVATPTWNTNTMALDLSASANIANYGELLGLSSYAQDNGYANSRATHSSIAGQFVSAHSGTSSGYRYALLLRDTSSTKASAGQYLCRLDKVSGAQAIDGVFILGNTDQFTYFLNSEGSTGCITITGTVPTNFSGRIAVKVGATPMWIPLYSTSNA